MYRIDAKLLNGETLELIGFRLIEVKSGKVRYFGINDVIKLVTSGSIDNAKLNNSGKFLSKRLKVNNTKLDELPNYYAVGGSEFLSYEEYSKRGTYAEKVEQRIRQIEEEKDREVAEFKSRVADVNGEESTPVQQELEIEESKVYVGIRRIDYKDGDTKVSLRVYSNNNFSYVLDKLSENGFDMAEDWKLDRSNIEYKYLDLYNLSTGQARSVIEKFGGNYCTVFENGSDRYSLANIKLNDRVYLGRVHLPNNELILISDDKIENSVINTIKTVVKTIIAGYKFIDKF